MNELNVNELEQANGGSFPETLKKYIVDPIDDLIKKIKPQPVIATEAKKDPVFRSMPELG